jgi:hypothetical protein
VKALARAWRWQWLLDSGVYSSVSEIGDAENISKSYVSRILRLALLALDIVEAPLATASWRPLRRPACRLRPEIYAKLTPLLETLANRHGAACSGSDHRCGEPTLWSAPGLAGGLVQQVVDACIDLLPI